MSNPLPAQRPFFSTKDIIITLMVSLCYLLLSYLLVGFNSNQIVLILIFNSLYYASPVTRKFILGFSIFIVYWILFDYMKAIPNYNFNKVHIAELYNLEKHFFGIREGAVVLSPNEYLRLHSTAAVDFVCGLFYLMWIPVPLGFAAYLFFSKRELFLRFSLTFVLVNLIGFVIYYLYPAAPPWYVLEHGFVFIAHTHSNPAGLIRFDQLVHVPVFQSIYRQGSNVFAAMPSLHSSYPLIVVYYGIRNRMGWVNMVFGIVMLGIWFTAVYASHHYMLDVLAGISCAVIGIYLFNWLSRHTALKSLLQKMLVIIQ